MADTVIGSLIYKITGDSAALDSSLDMSRQKIDRIGDSLIRLGQRARAVATVVFSGVFIKSLLESSSRVEELGNKFDTVFSGIERESDAWARKYANDTSRGVTATKEFLAAQQDLRTGYGDSVEGAARFSKAVVGVTNDLASFSNVPVPEAMAAVNSGLAQNFQALKRLGVSLSAETLSQGAYAKALGKTYDQMTALEKQEAILSGIVAQSKNALHQSIQSWKDYDYTIGDAARTSDSFANSSQGLAQSIEDMKAELGDALLPIATDMIQLALEGVKRFNSWDDSMQRLTVSALAFGAAMISIGGPVGAVVGSIGALMVLFSDQSSASDELAKATTDLKDASSEYSGIVLELSGNTGQLADKERALLEIHKALVESRLRKAVSDLSGSYNDLSRNIEKNKERAVSAEGAQKAWILAYETGYDRVAIAEEKWRLKKKKGVEGLSEEEEAYLKGLNEALYTFNVSAEGAAKMVEKYEMGLSKALSDVAKDEASLAESINTIAVAVANGTIDISLYATTNKELYDNIMSVASGLKIESEAIVSQTDAMASAIAVGDEWRARREEQLAGILDDLGEYQKAADVRKGILEEERKAELDALAVSAGIIKEGEQLTREKLNSALESDKEFAAEYYALNQYYTSEIAAAQKDASDKIEAETDRQRKAEQELADERKRNADEWKEKLRQQAIAVQQEAAAELEAEGDIEDAYAIRLRLINEEEARELKALQSKVDANKATEQDIMNLRAYYAEERDALQTKQEQAASKAADEAARKAKKLLDDQMTALRSFASEAVSLSKGLANAIVSLHGAATDGAIAEIDRQTKARLEAMGLAEKTEKDRLQEEYDAAVKSGDMKLAKEKSDAIARLAIEQEADEEKKRLQRKQAERERNMRIFETTIAMLSSIVKYLADPGSWAGIGLSAMAAITGAVQIAAIKAAPLPSFDVGVNYVPEDMLAMIHKGETILPAPMAESVRRGDAILGEGGAKVYVNIQNHSSENVDVSRGSDERELVITIGKVVDGQISSGRYDASLGYRYGLRRRGRDA